MSEEKTEQPTAKRLQKFREEGRVAKSQELGSIAVLFVGVYLLSMAGPRVMESLTEIMRTSYAEIGSLQAGAFSFDWLKTIASRTALDAALSILPWIGVLMFVGVSTNVAQTKGLVQPRLLIPKWERLNPLNRIRQIFGVQLFVETAKGVAKQLAIVLVVYFTVTSRIQDLVGAAGKGLRPGMVTLADVAYTMALQAAAVLLAIAVFDYIWQYRKHRQNLMMTKQEVKEEMKQQDGSPEIKNRVRRIQREMAQRRMMAHVPTADAVVVNPTHFAVAIRYNSETMEAPKIVAKGEDQVALKIISIARRNGIPVVPNRPLARALVRLPLNSLVPPEFFQAVAEVLAFVYSLRTPSAFGKAVQ